MRLLALWLLLAASSGLAMAAPAPGAQSPDDRQKSITAVRVARPPVIDGRLEDEAWHHTQLDERFTQNFPDAGRPPSEKTELYVVYDDRALYFGVRCHDKHPGQTTEWLTRRDRETNADKISIDIDSKNDHVSAYHFDVNVSGVLTDGVRFNDTDYTSDWDGLWNAVTRRDAEGWSVEVQIPWRTLRFTAGTKTMGFQVRRHLPRRQEIDAWAFIPRDIRGEVSRYGHLLSKGDLGPARLIQIAPYVSASLGIRSGEDTGDRVRVTPNAGADLKVGLTSGLTLDATLNPDFGQVEADQAQLNLSTFELFYPEKRPFFLEGVDLFATPLQQFYTRRVGRAPRDPELQDGEELVDSPTSGRIWGAVKLTGRLAPRLSIAVLDAVSARQTASVRRADGTLDRRRLADPLSNFAVLRLRSNFGNSYVGVTGTAVNRFEQRGDGAACGRPRCTSDAYTLGADARLATQSGTWGGEVHAVMSRIEHGPDRERPDGTVVRPGDTGWGLQVAGGKQGGEHALFHVEYFAASPSLDLNDAGFLRQANVHRSAANFVLRSTKPRGPTLEGNWELFTDHEYSWDGVRRRTGVGNWGWARFRNFWQLGTGFGYNLRAYDNREARDGARVERAGIAWWGLYFRTDPRRRVVVSYDGEVGIKGRNQPYANGRLTLSLHPLPHVELDIAPGFDHSARDPRWYATEDLPDGARRYRFGALDSTSFDVTLRATYTFTPKLTLQAYAQVFLASGHYSAYRSIVAGSVGGVHPVLPLSGFTNDRCPYTAVAGGGCDPTSSPDFRDGAINANLVLRWEYRPGSTLIVVYSHAQSQRPFLPEVEGAGRLGLQFFNRSPGIDIFQIKLSYLWG
ncbi:MAG TPA: DUF5916 domain-containing protein [Polyangia bacterium]|nr:DUF5916 domain-containing protein [Polyangia bacterium]